MSKDNYYTQHKSFTFNQIANLIHLFGGCFPEDTIEKILWNRMDHSAKFGSVTPGHVEAFINKIGGEEIFWKVLNDEIKLNMDDSSLKAMIASKKLFDKNGRRIPYPELMGKVCDANPKYTVAAPSESFILRNISKLLKEIPGVSLVMFKEKIDELTKKLKENPVTANLLAGTNFPIIIPSIPSAILNLGRTSETYIQKAKMSLNSYFGTNVLIEDLLESVSVSEVNTRVVAIKDGSRYEKLVNKLLSKPVFALYFPCALQGFSPEAALNQMSTLPSNIILSGLIDTSMAYAIYPEFLAKDRYTTGQYCSSFFYGPYDLTLSFRMVERNELNFATTQSKEALSFFSNGLIVLAE